MFRDTTKLNSFVPVPDFGNDDDDGMRKTAYRFTSKELDPETGLYYFGARYYDPRTSLWVSPDPLLGEYLSSDPSKIINGGVFRSNNLGLFSYAYNNPIILVDPDGLKVIVVFFHGGPTPFGRIGVDPGVAGGTGRRFNDAKAIAASLGEDFVGTVAKPGWFTHGYSGGVRPAREFVEDNFEEGDTVIIYGYSWGGDSAINLSESLVDKGMNVNLITVDASDGDAVFGNIFIDETVPDGVTAVNIYQTRMSGRPALQRMGCDSEFCQTRIPLPGSRGVRLTGENVTNIDVTGEGVTHGNIQDKAKDQVNSAVTDAIQR